MKKTILVDKIKLRSTDDIMNQLEDVLDSVLKGSSPVDIADLRIRVCKHAIQIIALSYVANKELHRDGKKLEHLSIK